MRDPLNAPHICPIGMRITSSGSFRRRLSFAPSLVYHSQTMIAPSAPARCPSLARALLALVTSLAMVLSSWVPAGAQTRISVVRDAEIEALVRDYVTPILTAAGLANSGIEIVLVNDQSFNAFVAGRRIFINTGALVQAETPNEIIGVLAHEAGHIAGGHLIRLREQIGRTQTMAAIAAVMGIGVGLAGAMTGTGGLAQGGAGLAIGGAEAARRNLLSYQRSEEITADRSAVTYLNATGQSARGMLRTFERFASSMALSGVRADPYQMSHPMPQDRIALLQALAQESPHYDRQDPQALQQRHDMVRAKIAAYTMGPQASSRLFRNDPRGVPALYGDAITTFLTGNPRSALDKIDALVRAGPNNPYFHEMRGEVLLRANRPAEAAEAISRAMQLESRPSGILQVARGRALLAANNPETLTRAISDLRAGLDRAPEYAAGYRYLAQALGQAGQIGEAELATAEGHFHSGSYRDAKIFAARAQQRLPRGGPAWVRAQDIINFQEPGRR